MLNVTKTREVVVDFRRSRTLWKEVQVVNDYKCLGVHPDNKLDWNCNIEAVYRKGQGRL